MSNPEGEEVVQLDSVLHKLGAFGSHQLVTMGMLALVYATNPIYNINYVFAVEEVNYRCKIPTCDVQNVTFDAPWTNISSPDRVAEGVRQCVRHPLLKSCGRFNTSAVTACDEWVYDIPNSFVAEILTGHGGFAFYLNRFKLKEDPSCQCQPGVEETVPHLLLECPIFASNRNDIKQKLGTSVRFGLACEDWKPTMVGTVHSFGNMLGMLLQGQISDRFGRKFAAVFSGTMGAILGLTKSFSPNFWTYLALEGLEAAIGDALSPIYMLSIEIVEKERAVLYQTILLNIYTVGLIVMPFIAWAVPYWRHFLRVIYAPTLLILLYSFYLDESIRWLFSKGKRNQAVKLIEKIAKRNHVKIDKQLLNKLHYVDEEKSVKVNHFKLLAKTFKSRIMMQRFLVCMVWWLSVTLINYGMMISSVLIDGNKYINFALLMLMDIPANLLFGLALSKWKRKIPLIASFIVGGIFCVSQPFMPKNYAWLGLALFMVFELLATFSYNIVYMYTCELFPTYTRNSMQAICLAIGRVGSLLAPQTPLLVQYYSGLPSLIFGGCSLLSGVLAMFMPETANTQLPDTVYEAEMIGKKKEKYDAALEKLNVDEQTKIYE